MKKGPNLGRVQVLANNTEIKELLEKGYKVKAIYLKLKEAGKITIGLRTFGRHVEHCLFGPKCPTCGSRISPDIMQRINGSLSTDEGES